ncbi:MAG: endo-1,4-beta-xylanase [Pirellulales bacterium]
MGVMKFLVPRRDDFALDAVERAYMAGLDEIPWRARIHWSDDGLSVERAEADSGNLFVPCLVDGRGELVLSTACLMERPLPYHLHVELARGTLNRLRNQIATWEGMGMRVPEAVRKLVHVASEQFAGAATRQDDPAVAAAGAMEATRSALEAIDALAAAFADQALATRHQAGKINALFGVNLGWSKPSPAVTAAILPAINTAVVPLSWRAIEGTEGQRDWSLCDAQIEWCRAHNLKICSGPLLQVDKWSLPDWMYLWGEGDEDSFRKCVAEHVDAVVDRYRGKVQLWQCAARLNLNNDFDQGEEERLRLAVLTVELIRRMDARTPIVLTLDQPWGSYMGREDYDLSPLHFADALVRAQLGIAGIGLEINFGYVPHGSEARDVVEFGRQIDRFGSLGLPLLISLVVPGEGSGDAAARLKDQAPGFAAPGSPAGEAQRAWAERYVPLLLTKQPVQGILWNQLSDSQPHLFAHGGLFDAKDRAKPIVEQLAKLRREHLV